MTFRVIDSQLHCVLFRVYTMANLDFSSSQFAQEMQENILDIIKRFHFEAPEEFDVTARLLAEICAHKDKGLPSIPEISSSEINNNLADGINKLVDILNEDYMYISREYLNKYPEKFIKTDYQIISPEDKEVKVADILSAISQATDEEIKTSFQALIFSELADQADYLSKITVEKREARIQERSQATKRIEREQEVLKKALPPKPEHSTVTDALAKVFGSTARYQEVIEKLSEIPAISNCTDVQGNIDGSYTDADAIKWSFTIQLQTGSKNNLVITMSNDQRLAPDSENTERVVATGQAICTFLYPNFNYAIGQHAISISSISDILHTIIRQRADSTFAYGYSIARDKTNSFEALLGNFISTSASREEMIEKIKSHQMPRMILSQNLLSRIFRSFFEPGMQAENSSDDEEYGIEGMQMNGQMPGMLIRFMSERSLNSSADSSDDEQENNIEVDIDAESEVAESEEESPVYSRENPRRSSRDRREPNRYNP